jgi:1,4-alpha-glucan branching enzyme
MSKWSIIRDIELPGSATRPQTAGHPASNHKMLMPKAKVRQCQGGTVKPVTRVPDRQRHEVAFVLASNGAEHVNLCGDFNDWQPAGRRMTGSADAGWWKIRLALEPGRYEYKFVVDGKWVHDPHARENVPNIHGSLNSVVEVYP